MNKSNLNYISEFNLFSLKIREHPIYDTSMAIRNAIKEEWAKGDIVDLFLDRFNLRMPNKDYDDILIQLNDSSFTYINEATHFEHEIQHFYDYFGSNTGLYLLWFGTDLFLKDIEVLAALRRNESSKDIHYRLTAYESGEKILGEMLKVRRFNTKVDSELVIQPNKLFARGEVKNCRAPYTLPFVTYPLSKKSHMAFLVNTKCILECKALLKQLLIVNKNFGSNFVLSIFLYFIKNLPSSFEYIVPIYPYLKLKGLNFNSNEDIISNREEFEYIKQNFIHTITNDLVELYELLDWSLMNELVKLTNYHIPKKPNEFMVQNNPALRFVNGLEASVASCEYDSYKLKKKELKVLKILKILPKFKEVSNLTLSLASNYLESIDSSKPMNFLPLKYRLDAIKEIGSFCINQRVKNQKLIEYYEIAKMELSISKYLKVFIKNADFKEYVFNQKDHTMHVNYQCADYPLNLRNWLDRFFAKSDFPFSKDVLNLDSKQLVQKYFDCPNKSCPNCKDFELSTLNSFTCFCGDISRVFQF